VRSRAHLDLRLGDADLHLHLACISAISRLDLERAAKLAELADLVR